MSENRKSRGGALSFLDPLAELFRARPEAPAPREPAANEAAPADDSLERRFDAALQALDRKIEESRAVASVPGEARERRGPDRAAAAKRRMEEARAAMRADIEAMHARLGTGIAPSELSDLASHLEELHASALAGRDAHSLIPRLRHVIADRLNREAGERAVARLVALLEREKLEWPDPTRHRPTDTPEEIERARRRRLHDVRQYFLAEDLERTAQRMLGVVSGWGPDYPERGSPSWEACVLEGVAAGVRAGLVREWAELLRRDRDAILARAQDAIGKELAAIHSVLDGGVHTLDQASRVVASSMGALDAVVPEIAWQHVLSQIGEPPAGPA
jgi:hypothetical protein